MSTEFRSRLSGEFAFLRFCRKAPSGEPTSFEFGTVTNFENVVAGLRAGETFESLGNALDSDPEMTAEAFEAMAASGRATFGEMSVTVEVGSGEMARFTLEE